MSYLCCLCKFYTCVGLPNLPFIHTVNRSADLVPLGVLAKKKKSVFMSLACLFLLSDSRARGTAFRPRCPHCWPPPRSRLSTSWRRTQVRRCARGRRHHGPRQPGCRALRAIRWRRAFASQTCAAGATAWRVWGVWGGRPPAARGQRGAPLPSCSRSPGTLELGRGGWAGSQDGWDARRMHSGRCGSGGRCRGLRALLRVAYS